MGWMVRFACFLLLHTYRSGLGPLEVAYPVLPSGLEKPFAEAMKALGVNPLSDPARDHFFHHFGVADPTLRQFTGNVRSTP